MLLKKGKWENIDQRVYYRENVFKELEWKHEKIKAIKHLERANADFEIIIKGIYYGVYNLHLTHDSRKDSATYKQKNSLTQIHWEKMSILIKDRDLLDRILKLYKRYELDGVKYLIEID
ncbi:MAG: hypothetical protein A2014_10705 [Spirochaetes bacterium GWF1_49_6]|nr:MAG: hypothetical protein A2014_10705 [Spirochaetes bacterium GWF1_49_6]